MEGRGQKCRGQEGKVPCEWAWPTCTPVPHTISAESRLIGMPSAAITVHSTDPSSTCARTAFCQLELGR